MTVTADEKKRVVIPKAKPGDKFEIATPSPGRVVLTRVETVSAFEEYGVTKEEVDRAYNKTVREIDHERKAGKLKAWKKAVNQSVKINSQETSRPRIQHGLTPAIFLNQISAGACDCRKPDRF